MLTDDQLGMASINAMLFSHGVKPDTYESLPHSFSVQDLINDNTDALLAYSSNEPFLLQEQNIAYTVFSPKQFNFDFYSDILFTSEQLIKDKPELVENFRLASLKGWQYAIDNPDETVELILSKYNSNSHRN